MTVLLPWGVQWIKELNILTVISSTERYRPGAEDRGHQQHDRGQRAGGAAEGGADGVVEPAGVGVVRGRAV
jgi:hypothetical protein